MNFRNSSLEHSTMRYMEREFVEPPEGVDLKTPRERALWRQYTNARRPSEWREIDLVFIARIIRFDAKEQEVLNQIEEIGDIIIDDKGRAKKNPLWGVLRDIDSIKRNMINNMGIAYYRQPTYIRQDLTSTLNRMGETIDQKEGGGLPFLAN